MHLHPTCTASRYILPRRMAHPINLYEITQVAQVMSLWSQERLDNYREMLSKDIDGEQMVHLHKWPQQMVDILNMKPMGQLDVFKLFCFFIGNGCHSRLAMYWIVSSFCFGPHDHIEGRCIHLAKLFNDVISKRKEWFCYNVNTKGFTHLDGCCKRWK